jgi:hypothetical protein
LRHVFETVVARGMTEGRVGGEGVAVDGSVVAAEANRQKGIEGTVGLPGDEPPCRAVAEYLAVLDEAAFGAATAVTPTFVSSSDPAAQWTAAPGGEAFFADITHDLIDLDHAVIVDVEATAPLRTAEATAARRMLERTRERFDLHPERLAADAGYGTATRLGWLVEAQGIEPHLPVFDQFQRRDGTFSRADVVGDRATDN